MQHAECKMFVKVDRRYYLICDGEIITSGSKQDCIDYFNNCSKPMPMQLIRAESIRELRKR